MTALTCPKCHGEMRQYERAGVMVDQCEDCRGVFLDRGELERLIDAENSWFERRSPQPRYAEPQYYEAPRYQQHGYATQHHKRRRKSFLEELFD